jgi:anti-sigma factor RsiW
MNEHLHTSEEDLILHYYGEHGDEAPVERHLASCGACRDAFARLSQVLALVDLHDAPEPGPAFEREVWARLEPHLAERRRPWFQRVFNTPSGVAARSWRSGAPTWALAGGIAALVLAAFVAGRFSTVTPPPSAVANNADDVAERVLVVAVVDHLDRSQMVLVELMNANLDESIDIESEQLRARELVTENRLYRQTAVQTGDGATGDVLAELERVLIEIANTPQDATKDDLEALRARIASRGLLFKVRVVHSEMRQRERQPLLPGSTS